MPHSDSEDNFSNDEDDYNKDSQSSDVEYDADNPFLGEIEDPERDVHNWIKFMKDVTPNDDDVLNMVNDLLRKYVKVQYKEASKDTIKEMLTRLEQFNEYIEMSSKNLSKREYNKLIIGDSEKGVSKSSQLARLLDEMDDIYVNSGDGEKIKQDIVLSESDLEFFDELAAMREYYPNFEKEAPKVDVFVLWNLKEKHKNTEEYIKSTYKDSSDLEERLDKNDLDLFKQIRVQQFIAFLQVHPGSFKTTNITVKNYRNSVESCKSLAEINKLNKTKVRVYNEAQLEDLKKIYFKLIKTHSVAEVRSVFKSGSIIEIIKHYGSEIKIRSTITTVKFAKIEDPSDIESFELEEDILAGLYIKASPVTNKSTLVFNRLKEPVKKDVSELELISLHNYIDWLYQKHIPVYEFGFTTSVTGITDANVIGSVGEFVGIDPLVLKFIQDNAFPKFQVGQTFTIGQASAWTAKQKETHSETSGSILTIKEVNDDAVIYDLNGTEYSKKADELWSLVSKHMTTKRLFGTLKPILSPVLETRRYIQFFKWAKMYSVPLEHKSLLEILAETANKALLTHGSFTEDQLRDINIETKLSKIEKLYESLNKKHAGSKSLVSKSISKSVNNYQIPDISFILDNKRVPIPDVFTRRSDDETNIIDENISTENIYQFFKNPEAYGYKYIVPINQIKNELYKNISTFKSIIDAINYYVTSSKMDKGFYFSVKTPVNAAIDKESQIVTDNFNLEYFHILPKVKNTKETFASAKTICYAPVFGSEWKRVDDSDKAEPEKFSNEMLIVERVDAIAKQEKDEATKYKKMVTRAHPESKPEGKGWTTIKYFKDPNVPNKIFKQHVLYTDFYDYLNEHRNVLFANAMINKKIAAINCQKIQKITKYLGDSADEMIRILNEHIVVKKSEESDFESLEGTPIYESVKRYCLSDLETKNISTRIIQEINAIAAGSKESEGQKTIQISMMTQKVVDVLNNNFLIKKSTDMDNIVNQLLSGSIEVIDIINMYVELDKDTENWEFDASDIRDFIKKYNNDLSRMKKEVDSYKLLKDIRYEYKDFKNKEPYTMDTLKRLKIVVEAFFADMIKRDHLLSIISYYVKWLYLRSHKNITVQQKLYLISLIDTVPTMSTRVLNINKLIKRHQEIDRVKIYHCNICKKDIINVPDHVKLHNEDFFDKFVEKGTVMKWLDKPENRNMITLKSLPKAAEYNLDKVKLLEHAIYKLSSNKNEYNDFIDKFIKFEVYVDTFNKGIKDKEVKQIFDQEVQKFRKFMTEGHTGGHTGTESRSGKKKKTSSIDQEDLLDIINTIFNLLMFLKYNNDIIVKTENSNQIFLESLKHVNTDLLTVIKRTLDSLINEKTEEETVEQFKNTRIPKEVTFTEFHEKIRFDDAKQGCWIALPTDRPDGFIKYLSKTTTDKEVGLIRGKYIKFTFYDVMNLMHYCFGVQGSFRTNYDRPRIYYRELYDYLVLKNNQDFLRVTDHEYDNSLSPEENRKLYELKFSELRARQKEYYSYLNKIEMDGNFYKRLLDVFYVDPVSNAGEIKLFQYEEARIRALKTGAVSKEVIVPDQVPLTMFHDESLMYPVPEYGPDGTIIFTSKQQETILEFHMLNGTMSTWLSSKYKELKPEELPYKIVQSDTLSLSNWYIKIPLRDPFYENRLYELKVGVYPNTKKRFARIPTVPYTDLRYAEPKHRMLVAREPGAEDLLKNNIYSVMNVSKLSRTYAGKFKISVWSWIPEGSVADTEIVDPVGKKKTTVKKMWIDKVINAKKALVEYAKNNPSTVNAYKDYITRFLEVERYKISIDEAAAPVDNTVWKWVPLYDVDVSFWNRTVAEFTRRLEEKKKQVTEQKYQKFYLDLTKRLSDIRTSQLPSIIMGDALVDTEDEFKEYETYAHKFVDCGLLELDDVLYEFNNMFPKGPKLEIPRVCRFLEDKNGTYVYTCKREATFGHYCDIHKNEYTNVDLQDFQERKHKALVKDKFLHVKQEKKEFTLGTDKEKSSEKKSAKKESAEPTYIENYNDYSHYYRIINTKREVKVRNDEDVVESKIENVETKTNRITLGEVFRHVCKTVNKKLFQTLRTRYDRDYKKYQCAECKKYLDDLEYVEHNKKYPNHHVSLNPKFKTIVDVKVTGAGAKTLPSGIVRVPTKRSVAYFPAVKPLYRLTISDLILYMGDSYQQGVSYYQGRMFDTQRGVTRYIDINTVTSKAHYINNLSKFFHRKKEIYIAEEIFKDTEFEEVASMLARRLAFLYAIDINEVTPTYANVPSRVNLYTEKDIEKYAIENHFRKRFDEGSEYMIV
jgi:hypothetical protein